MIDMSTPVGQTPLDAPGGLVGQPLDRIDGPLKVRGLAPYAAEYRDLGPVAYGYLVTAGIGAGTLTALDTAAAEKAPGVLLVITHRNAPRQGAPSKTAVPQLAGDEIAHFGQPIALVVADSFEKARSAAYLVKPTYTTKSGDFDFKSSLGQGAVPKGANGVPPDTGKGDAEAALAKAPVVVDVTYTTPAQTHAMMEPHATIASWDGDALTLRTANQMLPRGVQMVCDTLLIPKEKVRLISPYVGGGFGAKLEVQADAVLAALAARMLGHPVKVALTRQQLFHVTTHRSDTSQRVRLGADRDGGLVAVVHDSWSNNTPGQSSFETAAQATRNIYATPNLKTTHRLVTLNLPVSAAMRAPGEAVGLLALESAMDELAVALDMDPIDLREKNEPSLVPNEGKPFSTRTLLPCLREGATRFGWNKRSRVPGQMRDGDWLVGMGVSAAIRNNPMLAAKASVALDRAGMLTVRTSMTDIGTGSYTILGQIAADMLGLPIGKVRVLLGDTTLPAAPGSGGSFGANSAGAAVYDACMTLRDQLLAKAVSRPGTRDSRTARSCLATGA